MTLTLSPEDAALLTTLQRRFGAESPAAMVATLVEAMNHMIAALQDGDDVLVRRNGTGMEFRRVPPCDCEICAGPTDMARQVLN